MCADRPCETTIARHVALLEAASRRVGMDLQDAAIRGVLRFEEISDAVLRCTGCSEPDNCEAWMAGRSRTGLPPYCRNADLFERLGRGRL